MSNVPACHNYVEFVIERLGYMSMNIGLCRHAIIQYFALTNTDQYFIDRDNIELLQPDLLSLCENGALFYTSGKKVGRGLTYSKYGRKGNVNLNVSQ